MKRFVVAAVSAVISVAVSVAISMAVTELMHPGSVSRFFRRRTESPEATPAQATPAEPTA